MAVNGITIGKLYAGWIGSLGESARSNYSSNIKEFFQLMYNKSVDEVTEEDLASIRPHNVQTNYINELMKNCKNSTIKYKVKNIQQFMSKLNINRVYKDVNYAFINDVALSTTNLRDDSSRTRKMTKEDLEALKEWFVNDRYAEGRYSYKGKIYATLVDFMYVTGSRISASFKVKWTDIKQRKDDYGQLAYVIYIRDKGNKLEMFPITDEFHTQLKEVLYDGNDEVTIFNKISQRGFTNDIKQFAQELDLHEEDIFTPHSIRSLAITTYYGMNKDIVATKNFANHESIETTVGYIQDDNNFMTSGSYMLSSPEVTIDDISDLSKEELLSIIKGKEDIIHYIYNNKDK